MLGNIRIRTVLYRGQTCTGVSQIVHIENVFIGKNSRFISSAAVPTVTDFQCVSVDEKPASKEIIVNTVIILHNMCLAIF